MVLISHRFKFIYIKNVKVAGTSIEAYFEKYCMDPTTDHIVQHKLDSNITKYGIVGNRENGKQTKYYNHMSAKEIKNYIGNDIFNSYFKFCVVRNPYDKMVSLYNMIKYRDGENVSFNDFVRKQNCVNYNRYFINNKSCIDFYIRFEFLNEDLEKVCKKLNIEYDISKLPKFKSNYRKDNDYKEYYNEELKKIVYDKHKEEFELFGYKY